MHKYFLSFVFIFSLSFLNAESISVMTINAQNLFDTIDDPGKDDKAYLPIEMKESDEHKSSCNKIRVNRWKNECLFQDWNYEAKAAKLNNLLELIVAYDSDGADIIGLQEVENINILNQLFDLLEPYGYIDFILLEGSDNRGIDTAFISKYKISNPKLHYVEFSAEYETIDTRPILEVDISINNKLLKFYNSHFPSNYHPVQMRIQSFDKLKELVSSHSMPAVALGDFNLTNKDDKKFEVFKGQEDFWYVAHREGCEACLGTYYYNRGKSWDFLDTIMATRDRGIHFDKDSIEVFINELNSYKNTGKPHWFNPETKLGVTDHFPMVAKIKLY